MRRQFTPPEFWPGCEVKSIADKDEYTTDNGWIEAVVGAHGQQRVRYLGYPVDIGTANFYVDVEYFPVHKIYRVFGPGQGGTAATGGVDTTRVSQVYRPNLAGTVIYADNGGTANFNGDVALLSDGNIIIGGYTILQVIPHFLALPGLRGCWPMSAYDASGNAFDQSSNGRTLTYNGNPTYNYDNLAPYLDFDGTGDYLTRTDEAGLDILGTESYVANPGLTLGGWFWFDVAVGGGAEGMITKHDTASARSYRLFRAATSSVIRFAISSNGSSDTTVSGDLLDQNQWYFVVGRYTPSTEVAVFLNDGKTTNITSIPASIFNSATDLNIGAHNGAFRMTGRASLCFLCAAALSDAIIGNLFQQSRVLFGV
jgi:hypothetical protein